MCKREQVHGLRMFLYGVIELIKNNEIETVNVVEGKISTGVASYLYFKYPDAFEAVGFNGGDIDLIDGFFKKSDGLSDDADRKYLCKEKEGLYFILKLALNEVY